jgi:hypothetical protein
VPSQNFLLHKSKAQSAMLLDPASFRASGGCCLGEGAASVCCWVKTAVQRRSSCISKAGLGQGLLFGQVSRGQLLGAFCQVVHHVTAGASTDTAFAVVAKT